MKALILIDFQNEWITPSSEYYVGSDLTDIIKKINSLIEKFRESGHKIIFTQHFEKDDNSFKEGTKESEIINSLDKQEQDPVIIKNHISPFYKTTLEKELSGVNSVTVCGILTNLCVRHFVEDAYDRGFNIQIIKDCCVSFDPQTQDFTLKDLQETRPEIEILNSSEI